MTKPPLPAAKFLDWPRISVDTTEGSTHYGLTNIARRVATIWVKGPDGPYSHPGQTMSETIGGVVGAALLHLMELGLIDADTARLDAAPGIPWGLDDFRPDGTQPPRTGDTTGTANAYP